jgi:hypothetical protein
MPEITETDWLEQIRSCNDMTTEGEAMKIRAIKGAKDAGISWRKIGQAMGVTGQAAGQRYGRYVLAPAGVTSESGKAPKDEPAGASE